MASYSTTSSAPAGSDRRKPQADRLSGAHVDREPECVVLFEGRSLGLLPLKMRATRVAVWRKIPGISAE